MYIIAGSTGTLGTAIVDALSKDNELFLIGRDETKLKEQASAINADYQVIDLNNTVEPREFAKIIDTDTEIKGLVNCIGSILIKPLHGTTIDEFNDVITTNLFSSYYLLASFARRMKNGSAIFFSSVAGSKGLSNHEAIAAAKSGIEGFAREYIDPIKPRQEGPAVSQEEETPDGTPGGQSGVEEMSKPFDRFEKRRREETTSIRQKHLGEEGDFKVDTELNAMLTEIKGRLGIKEEDVIEKAQSEKIWKELKEAILRKNDEVLSTIENIPPPINKQIINNLWKPNIPDIPREANGSNRCWVNAPLYSILQNNIIRDKIRTNQSEFAKELLKFIGEEDGVGGVWNDTLYLDFIQKYEDNLFQPKPTAGKEETELQKQLDDKTILNKNRSKLSEIMDERSKRERERDEDIRSVLNGSFWDADYTIKFLVKEFKKLNINLSYHSVFPNPEGDQIPCAKSDANSMITGPTNGPIWKNCIKYDRDEKKPLNKLLSLVQSFKATIPSELKSSLDLKYGINYAKEQGVPPSAIDDILNGVKEGIDLGAHEIIKIIEDGGDISRIFNKSEILTIMSRIAHQVLREVGHFRSFIPIEVKKGEFSSEKFNDSYNWLRVDALKGFKPTDHPPIPSNEAYSFYIFLENEDEGESIKRGGGKRRVRTNKKRKGRRVNRTEKKNKRSRKKGNRRSRNERTPRERVQRNEKTPNKKRTLKKRR